MLLSCSHSTGNKSEKALTNRCTKLNYTQCCVLIFFIFFVSLSAGMNLLKVVAERSRRQKIIKSSSSSPSSSSSSSYYYNHFTAPWTESRTTRVSRYHKGKTRKVKPIWIYWSKRQWVAMTSAEHMQICISPQTDNHTSIPPLSFLQAGCPSCRPTNSIKALKANHHNPDL